MKEFSGGGKKDLQGKLPYHLITAEMTDAIATGLQCGQRKGYEPRNWEKGLPFLEGHIGAIERHIAAFKKGEDLNSEIDKHGDPFTLNHTDNIVTHAAMLATQVRRNRVDLDDRPKLTKSKLDIDRDELAAAIQQGYEENMWGGLTYEDVDYDDRHLLTLPNDKLYYLASPYTHYNKDVQAARHTTVTNLAIRLIKERGLDLILPITTSAALVKIDPELGSSWEVWKKTDTNLVKHSDVVLVAIMPGVAESVGVKAEIEVAQQNNIPVLCINPKTLAVWRN